MSAFGKETSGGSASAVSTTPKQSTPSGTATKKTTTTKKTTSTKAATTTSATATSSSSSDKAASFGYSLAFFNSNPELKALLDRATSQNYTSERFVAELQNTQWFRANGESARKYAALSSTDPATLAQMTATAQSHITTLAGTMGVGLSATDAAALADLSIKVGWSEDQIKAALADKLSTDASGGYSSGQAAALNSQFKGILSDYGVQVSDQTLGQWVRDGILGKQTADSVKAYAQQAAASQYAGLADRINAGYTVKQIADPYIQSQARLLELNPDSIGLSDPSIQQALMSKDQSGKPAAMSVWEYEQQLRNDPRWVRTQNAQDSLMGAAKSVLQQWGVIG